MNPAYENYSYRPYIQPNISVFVKAYTEEIHNFALPCCSFFVLFIITLIFILTYSEGTEKSAIDLSDFCYVKALLF